MREGGNPEYGKRRRGAPGWRIIIGAMLNRSAYARRSAHPAHRGRRRTHAAGFTLIEIMVVIVILGILAALIVPRVLERPDEARAVAAKSDIAAIMQALRFYRIDNQRYPTTEQGLAALATRPTQPPLPPNWKTHGYLERLPKDPWGHPYQYLYPGLRGEVDVFSFGADGQSGGSGTDADIGSWDL
jgi:general secretion pathway protein G